MNHCGMSTALYTITICFYLERIFGFRVFYLLRAISEMSLIASRPLGQLRRRLGLLGSVAAAGHYCSASASARCRSVSSLRRGTLLSWIDFSWHGSQRERKKSEWDGGGGSSSDSRRGGPNLQLAVPASLWLWWFSLKRLLGFDELPRLDEDPLKAMIKQVYSIVSILHVALWPYSFEYDGRINKTTVANCVR